MKKQLHILKGICLFLFLLNHQNSKAQTSLNFDGVNDYVQTSYTGISGNNARTIEAWIKTTENCNPSNGGSQQVIADWGIASTGARFTFNILWSNAIRVEVQGNGVSGTIAVNDGEWHHVAAVYDPTASLKLKLYVDGVLDYEDNFTVPVNTGSNVNLRIGKRVDNINLFKGSIDEVRVWDVARTQSELNDNKNIEFCTAPSSLKAYYKCNEGVANGNNSSIASLTDYSGNNNNGTLEGFTLNDATSNFVVGPTNLNSVTIDTSVTITANSFMANQANGTYQWVNCDTNNSPIAGETSNTFSPSQDGNYAVEITLNGCTEMSNCEAFLDANSFTLENSINVYPNPTKNIVTIGSGNLIINEITVYNYNGVMLINEIVNSNKFTLNLESYSSGIFLIKTKTDDGTILIKKVTKN